MRQKTDQERMKEATDELEAEALRLSNGDPILAAAHIKELCERDPLIALSFMISYGEFTEIQLPTKH